MKTIEELKKDWKVIISSFQISPNSKYSEFVRSSEMSMIRICKPSGIDHDVVTLVCENQQIVDRLNNYVKWIPLNPLIDILSDYLGSRISRIDITQGLLPEDKAAREEMIKKQEQEEKELRARQRQQKLIDMRFRSRIPDEWFNSRLFENFEVKNETQKRGLEAAKKFIRFNFTDEQFEAETDHTWSLLLHGTCGTGKTHLAVAIGIYALNNGIMAVFWSVPELLVSLRQGLMNDTYYELLREVKYVEILILDDWGSYKTTEWVDEQLDAIIDHRYSNDMDTVITTNIPFKNLQPRVRSRLSEGAAVAMVCDDYRLIKGIGKVAKKPTIRPISFDKWEGE